MKSSFCPVSDNYLIFKESPDFVDLAPSTGGTIEGQLGTVFVDMSHAIGSGSVISTSADLIKWGNYLFKDAPKVIRDNMLHDYGSIDSGIINLGLGVQDTPQLGKWIGHCGGIECFSSVFTYAPESDTMIIALNNNEDEFDQLMESLGSWLQEPEGYVSCFVSLNTQAEKLIWSWTKELLKENKSYEFAKAYNEAHPYAEENGYGPLALIVYDSSNLSGDAVSDSYSLA